MTKLMVNHPLFSFNILNDETKFDLAIIQAKDNRRRSIDDAVRQYFDRNMPTSQLKYLRDNYDEQMEIYYAFQDLTDKGVCMVCSKKAKKKCSICDQEYYCSNACQRSHWKEHIRYCHHFGMMRLGALYGFGKNEFIQELLDYRERNGFTEKGRVEDRERNERDLAMEIKIAEKIYANKMKEIMSVGSKEF